MNPLTGVIIALIGVASGAIVGVFRIHKIPNKKFVDGEVVAVETKLDLDAGTQYGYVDYYVNGVAYSVKSTYASSSFHVGRIVRIAYNSENPSQAMIAPSPRDYVIMLLFVIGGIIFTVVSFFK